MAGIGGAWAAAVLIAAGAAEMRLTEDTVVVFAGQAEGQELLARRDEFVRRMSPLDRAARLRTGREVSEDEYRRFAQQQVLEWTEPEQAKVLEAVQAVRRRLGELNPPWPAKIRLIKTSGLEEGGAAYTRSTAIVLPQPLLQRYDQAALQRLICHELFHILSRYQIGLREQLYAIIGFHRCRALDLPEQLADGRIHNPDAPAEEYSIRVRWQGEAVWAVPLLVRRDESDAPPAAGEFFDYFHLRLLLVETDEDGRCTAVSRNGEPILVMLNAVEDFYQQVGRNTRYVIHPDEILADNFVLLMMENAQEQPTPEILEQMSTLLRMANSE